MEIEGSEEYYDYYAYDNTSYYFYPEEDASLSVKGRLVSSSVFLYMGIPLLVLGTLGNLLSLVVFQTRDFRSTASGFLLSALALTDTGVLYTGLLRHVVLAVTGDHFDVRALSSASCKTHTFFTYMLLQLAAWTLVLLTVERLLAVTLPSVANNVCKKTYTLVAWIVTLVVLCGVNSHTFATMTIMQQDYSDRGICFHDGRYEWFWMHVWSYVDSTLSCFLPSVVMLLGIVVSCNWLCTMGSTQYQRGQDGMAIGVTSMVVTATALFLLMVTPSAIYMVGFSSWPKDTHLDYYRLHMSHVAVNMLLYSYCAFKFLTYCASGTVFRTALADLIGCKPPSRQQPVQLQATKEQHIPD